MLSEFLKSIFGSHNDRVVKKYMRVAEEINSYEKEFSNLLAVKKEMEDREETLKEQIAISQSVVMHIAEIKKNPKDIFQKIDEFEKASQLRKERKQEEPELQRKKNELITDMKQKKKKVEEKVVKDQEEEGGETA